MRTIAILNLKGGVGKTVTAINMASILAGDHKKRVLLIDADSQCNTTEFFGGDPKLGNLAEILDPSPDALSASFGIASIRPTMFNRLDMLPASDELMDLDLTKVQTGQVRSTALLELREHLMVCDCDYDFTIIDCPPAFSASSAAALLAADEVIIPIKLDAFSVRGMANLLRQVADMRQINPRLRVAGCLITMRYRDAEIAAAEAQLRASALPVFATAIRRSGQVDRMTFSRQPLRLFSPRSCSGVDYRRFVREYLEGGAHHV